MTKRFAMRLVQVAGWLGSGKTTLIIALGRGLSDRGKKVAIVVNEIGAVPVDGRVVQECGLMVKEIGGGCICCEVAGNMVRTLKALAEGPKPEVVIIEPTGLALPGSIRQTIMLLPVHQDISSGTTIVLFDTTRMDKLLGYESLKRLVVAQMVDADIIALSKADSVSKKRLLEAHNAVSIINPGARVLPLSTNRGEGVAELIQAADAGGKV
jgi:G3E family GTPase